MGCFLPLWHSDCLYINYFLSHPNKIRTQICTLLPAAWRRDTSFCTVQLLCEEYKKRYGHDYSEEKVRLYPPTLQRNSKEDPQNFAQEASLRGRKLWLQINMLLAWQLVFLHRSDSFTPKCCYFDLWGKCCIPAWKKTFGHSVPLQTTFLWNLGSQLSPHVPLIAG